MVIKGTTKVHVCFFWFFIFYFEFYFVVILFNILQLCIDMYKFVYVTGQV